MIDLNRQALALLHSQKRLAIVPGATHLFEEPTRSALFPRWRAIGSSAISTVRSRKVRHEQVPETPEMA
ncbi:hypothetical protein [Variovorax sp. LjRoot130]|uniref:hypothetical protein n=1 Tax=Variovorax sp. LjRoot130 TaxID=3342261 RepID=UPI003F50FF83